MLYESLPAMLADRARTVPEHPAVSLAHETVTYRELQGAVERACAELVALGLEPGERLVYLGRNSADPIVLFFVCARLGLRLVLPNWRLSAREMAMILDDAAPALILVVDEFLSLVERESPQVLTWDDWQSMLSRPRPVSDQESGALAEACRPDDDLVICYTSGSTGRPKGVRQTHANWLAVIEQMRHWPGGNWRIGATSLCLLPFFHVAGLRAAILPLAFKGTAVIPGSGSVEDVVEILRARPIDTLSAVPTVLKFLLDADPEGELRGRVRTMLYGGAAIPAPLIARARTAYGCEFVQTYGASETTGTAVALDDRDHTEEALAAGCCGRPLPGIEVSIRRQDGNPADVGEEGEIYLRGPSIAAGYWRQPEQTQKRFVDGWFRPGDVGRLDERGFLYFAGRDGDVIRTGGEKVFPREVEQVLLAHPDVVDACAYGRPDPTWGEAVHAVVALKPGADLTVAALQVFCRSHLSAFKCPRFLKILEQIPRNAGGKVDRTQLLLQAEA